MYANLMGVFLILLNKKGAGSNEWICGVNMKKLVLGVLGLAFAFALSSCGEQNQKKKLNSHKYPEKAVERHHDRW